jgi:hypothetical protein
MGIFSDSIQVSGSHAPTKTAESAIVASSSDKVNKATITQAIRQMQGTGGTVNLSLSRFATDTLHPGGKSSPDQTITIKPGDDADAKADEILAALSAQGADRAEKSLVAATLNASAASIAGQDLSNKSTGMSIRLSRAGGLAEYAAK